MSHRDMVYSSPSIAVRDTGCGRLESAKVGKRHLDAVSLLREEARRALSR